MRHVVESFSVHCDIHGELVGASSRLGAERIVEKHFETVSYNEADRSFNEVPCRCRITTEYTWEWD